MKKFLISICGVLCCIILSISCIKIDFASAEENDITINAKSAFLMDFNSSDVLLEQNADEKTQVASIVKLMTALLTLEELNSGRLTLDEKLITTENASGMGGSQVFIDPYTEYSVDEMLKSLIVASANDASVALAEKISGSEEVFVKKMNQRAKELGLKSTIYTNASGLPEPGQYSTARDTAKLLKEVLKYKEYFKYSTIWMDKLTHPSGRETEVVNTNKLIRYFKGCDGGKTGSTDEAGYCLAATAERGGMRLISIVLGAKTGTERFNESSKLLNYGFTNFENSKLVCSEGLIAEVQILNSKTISAPVYAAEDFYAINKKDENPQYDISIDLPEKIKAPLTAGDKVGSLIISKNGAVVKEIAIIIGQDIDKLTYGESLKEIISRW